MGSGQFSILRSGLAGVDAVVAETSHSFPRHWHEHYGIGVIFRGAQKSLSGRGMVEAGAGDTITVNPGEVHDGVPIGDHGRAWTMLYFDPALIREFADDIGEGRPVFRELTAPVISEAAIAHRFKHLFAAVTDRSSGSSRTRCEELLLGLLAGVAHERSSLDAPTPPPSIRRARQRIDEEPTAAVTLADLAAESGLSRFQMLRGFVRATGLTPHAYLIQRRTDLARRLIAAGTGLAEAAAASGFADQSHMTRTFVRKYGVSPGRYASTRA